MAGYSIPVKYGGAIPDQSATYLSAKPRTFYSQEYCTAMIDEGHVARKRNKFYYSFRVLQALSTGIVVMTATPIYSSPMVSKGHFCLLC